MSQQQTNALAVLEELLKSASETVRLQAAVALLQFASIRNGSDDARSGAGPPVGNEQSGVQSIASEVVRAGRFELIGADGKVQAILGKVEKHPADSEFVGPGVGLALLDKDGHPQIRLCADNHDGLTTSQGLTIYDISGKYRVNLGASAGGGGLGIERGTAANFEVFIGGQSPILRFTDKDGKERLSLALDTFKLVAADESVLFKAP